jgi:uncharacterized protein YndB with AHSA1/START domain
MDINTYEMETVKTNTTIELEFTLNTSPSILFNRLSTPSGLAEWFADDVNLNGNVFSFIWDKVEHKAEVISKKENKFIRFRWLNNGLPPNKDTYFEFRINLDELTAGLSLFVTEVLDYDTDEDEVEDTTSLWEHQISELKRNLGV